MDNSVLIAFDNSSHHCYISAAPPTTTLRDKTKDLNYCTQVKMSDFYYGYHSLYLLRKTGLKKKPKLHLFCSLEASESLQS